MVTAGSDGRSVLGWAAGQLLTTVVQSLIVTVFFVSLTSAFQRDAPLVGVWAITTVSVLALRLHRLIAPRVERRRSSRGVVDQVSAQGLELLERGGALIAPLHVGDERVLWADPLPMTLERRFTRMYRHTDRITYAVVAERHYVAGVQPVLRDLASDRLRRHCGVDLARHPEDARAVLGEDLWHALSATPSRPPTVADLDRWIGELERLVDPRALHHQSARPLGSVSDPQQVPSEEVAP